jgi:DNA-binding response OmpR family regulator
MRLHGCVVLVVEDESLISMNLAAVLSAEGADVVCARRSDEAISMVERFQVSAAVLDINLGDHDCVAICDYLRERRIPFLFHTGYSAPLAGWDVPLIKKPASAQEITCGVEQLCSSRREAA